jgi:hypothetical protein
MRIHGFATHQHPPKTVREEIQTIGAVIPRNGSLLIIEFILPPLVWHQDPQLEGRPMSDLNMLAVTAGKERSEREWKTLLDAAGFILTGVHPVGGDNLTVRNVGIVEAKPA